MENTSAFESFELQINELAKGYLAEIAKWARFLAITGFIFLGIYVLFCISVMVGAGFIGSQLSGMGTAAGIMGGLFYMLLGLLYFFPILYLYNFAAKAKKALAMSSTADLTDALKNLKSHYKFVGILMIVALSFYAIAIIFLIAGLASNL